MHDRLATDPARVLAAAAALRAAGEDGRLDRLCEDHDVAVLTLHGSVARGADDPHDLDLGVQFASGRGDLVAFATAIMELVHLDEVDVMDVSRASVTARARALAHGAVPLFEHQPGAFARAQMAACSVEMDFAPLRRRQLRALANR